MTSTPPTRIRPTTLSLTGARLGPPSSLPALDPVRPATFPTVDPDAPAAMRERVARGRLRSPLPYALLSDYDRAADDLELPAVELANDDLCAVVVPALGGRVWSLTDLRTGRDLVHRAPQLRWANFGLTDAWFAGGIEWNLGSTGHSAISNQPRYAAVIDGPDGPVLRLWEWERTRDLLLQVDLWLDGPRLLAATRVTNPDPEDKPLYDWTNIAVPETVQTRVLTPATSAWRTNYEGTLERVEVPFPDGAVDISVPRASTYPADYFYEVEEQSGRIVAAVEPDGAGLTQTSTSALRGRKLFLWGDGPGGRRWQDWLGGAGARYLEIQAGVCPTQLEHDVISGGASLSWVECFAPLQLTPADVGGDYPVAAEAARAATHAVAPPDWLEAELERWESGVADRAPAELLHQGSGWGQVELALRGTPTPEATPFAAADDDSAHFARVAATADPADLPTPPATQPLLPLVSDRWLRLFTEAATSQSHWWLHYAIGTAHHLRRDEDAARTAYVRSIADHPSAVALRGLALLSADPGTRIELLDRAHRLAPEDRRLAVEWLEQLRDAGRGQDVAAAVADLPGEVREHGRIQLLHAEALASLGDRDGAAAILESLLVPDLAEGDLAITRLWQAVHPDVPVPGRLDFAMIATDRGVSAGSGSGGAADR